MRQDVGEFGLGPDTGGRRQGDQAHRTAAGSEQSELRLLENARPVPRFADARHEKPHATKSPVKATVPPPRHRENQTKLKII